jgi:DNA adenine methylase
VFAEKLKSAELHCRDFRKSFAQVQADHVVYCDPPYVPLSKTANFTDYATGGFTAQDQRDLAQLSINAAKKGALVLVSNHDTLFTRKLYKQAAKIIPVLVSRTISCNGENRKKAKELIAVFGGHQV